jgi:RNA polymerase sigma factor (sigma-70 family)
MSDHQALVQQCLKGDRKAQKQLYNSYATQMLGVCLRYASDRAEAEDMLQEGFVKVFQSLKDLRDYSQLGAWIQKIMVTTALMHLRKQRLVLSNSDDEITDVSEPAEDESATSNLSREELLDLIQQMPPGFRAVFNLCAIEGFSHKAISEQLNITVGTVKSQYARAKKMLQEQVKEMDPELVNHLP